MQGDECRLCKIVKQDPQNRKEQDTLIVGSERFEWIPGLGAFVEGYSLVVSKAHLLNTGCLDAAGTRELEGLVANVRESLRGLYGTGSVIFEHGTMGGVQQAGSCVEHHHLHIIPVDLPTVPAIIRQRFGSIRPIEGLSELTVLNDQKSPYVYYQTSSGEQYAFEAPVLPRQYMRQVLAAECGAAENWDWRVKPFGDRINAFVSLLVSQRAR